MLLVTVSDRERSISQVQDRLLERISNGDKSAVTDCVNQYGGLVWSLARRMTRSQADAEDAVQEIFIALWKAADRFDASKSSEPTFVAMVARRRLIDFGRRQRSAKQMPDTVSATAFDDDFVATQDTGPGEAIERCEEATQAIHILNQLPNEQSQAIRLSVFDGLTHKQIAENMSLPLGTIKTHIRRGLIKVRDRLAQPANPANPGGEL